MGFMNNSQTSTMGQLCVLVLVLMMLLSTTKLCLVDGRALRPETEVKNKTAVDGRDFVPKASVSDTAKNTGGRVLTRDQEVFTMASGPSRKGSGH